MNIDAVSVVDGQECLPREPGSAGLSTIADFVLANTRDRRPLHVPEIRLRLADEVHDLWKLTEDELGALGLPPPFWAFAWAGGLGLSRYILDNPHIVHGRSILDFASGSGLVAIAAAMAGAGCVAAVDTDRFAGEAARINAASNSVAIAVEQTDIVGFLVDADIILAGDVFYDREFARRLVPWFDELTSAGRDVLVGDPGRAYLPADRVTRLATYEVPVSRVLEDAEVKRTTVWRWRSRD